MAQSVTICNLLSYEIKRVDLEDLKSDNIRSKIISYFSDLKDNERLKIYILYHSGFLRSLGDTDFIKFSSLKSYNDIKLGSNVIIFDLFLIGQSVLNQDSFSANNVVKFGTSVPLLLEEKQEALQLFALFASKISCRRGTCQELGHMVTSCLENKYIERNLSGFTSETAHSDCDDVLTIGKRLETVQPNDDTQEKNIDSLINICNSLTLKTCKVLNSKIKQHNYKPEWADVLKEDEFITVSLTNQSPPINIQIHSNVFLFMERYHSGHFCNNNILLDGDLKKIGKGAFGIAFKYTPSNQEQSLVIKRTETENDARKKLSKPSWFREGHHTQQLCHPNIIRYFGKPVLYGDQFYCFMEYGGLSLEDIYCRESGSGRRMDLNDICKASLQVSDAIKYLHTDTRETFVIHRDIRTGNVTRNDSGVYKLIDFGISSEKKIEECSKIDSDAHLGHHLWKSPEFCWKNMITDNNGATAGSQDVTFPEPGRGTDIWMFGVFLLELFAFPNRPSYFNEFRSYGKSFMESLTKKVFTMEKPIQECLDKIGDGDTDIQSKFMNVLKSCLAFDVSSRANCEQLYKLCQELPCNPTKT
ncbi:probable serine/threonine-protein kinase mkcC [Bolinopsis microptera]|uniref:probable serine/threonine-protein kinase mkcC n=1 Tax=Bolinopsis microptera TaxID=2820187 RepID=UPI003078C180